MADLKLREDYIALLKPIHEVGSTVRIGIAGNKNPLSSMVMGSPIH